MVIWPSLLSGLIGAVIGAGATVLATWFAINKTAKIDQERRQQQSLELKSQIIKSLKIEIEYNLELAKVIFIGDAKVPFSNDAYQLSKVNSSIMPPELFDLISPVYEEITKYNSLIRYDLQIFSSVSHGNLNNKFIEINKIIIEKLISLKEEIKKFSDK